jgi:hypothetical protein
VVAGAVAAMGAVMATVLIPAHPPQPRVDALEIA